jgi:hypothetical protein
MGKTKLKATDKQIAANRRNAARATGPITPDGKAAAARNALKHGLLAQEIVIDDGEGAESRAQFDAVLLDLTRQFEPQGPLEEMLVEKIAVAYWRLRRAHRYEVGLLRKKLDNATDQYYNPGPSHGDEGISPDDQLDAQIAEAQELRQEWQDDSKQFAKLRKAGKDPQEIYGFEANWDWLYHKAAETVEDLPDESPADIHQSLQKAGWTDDDIWQSHMEICAEQIESQTRTIRQLQEEKQKNKLAIQVHKKLGNIPDTHDLDRLLRYEGAIERQFYKAIDQLERLQRMRAGDTVPAPVNLDVAVNAEERQ